MMQEVKFVFQLGLDPDRNEWIARFTFDEGRVIDLATVPVAKYQTTAERDAWAEGCRDAAAAILLKLMGSDPSALTVGRREYHQN
jgi:hypothetical protein